MATKSVPTHLEQREFSNSLMEHLQAGLPLETFEFDATQPGVYRTGAEWAKAAGVTSPDDAMAKAQQSVAYWGQKPKRDKMSAISEEFRRTLPYVAAAAPFAGAGSVLGSVAKGTSGLGKFGAILTGGGNFSKNPLVNMAIKQALSKAAGGAGMDTLGSVMKMGGIGHGAADMFNKGIYAPEKAPALPTADYQGPQIDPKTGQRAMPGSMGDYWEGIGKAAESVNAGGDPITSGNMYDWMEKNYPGAYTGGTNKPTVTGKPGGGFGGGQAGGGANPLAMGLLTSLLGKAFEGDDKPSPAPAPAPSGGAGLPTYGSLIGMATNRDAMEDQRNRLKFGRRTA